MGRLQVGTFIALSCCHPTIQSFRDQQLKNVAEGRRVVLSVQKIRTPGLDKFLACASFCAEEVAMRVRLGGLVG